ncbi:MAG: tRNA (adenosine(37)-N6)-threonylcarbamoyltransferase complex ATPase subunit type 1 TsaE [Bdellovibrio sp.]|nr:tRNA (adenosine(37)-N6)-threonylcarbamoyltransferase complex ATPase subunit type 1 TsaE [Bdellovibrio sp.]
MKTEELLFTESVGEAEISLIVNKLKKLLISNSILLLEGEVAAGKTTLTRYLGESYSLPIVQSPTYAIHQRYQNSQICIDHLDLYRLRNEDEVETSGLWDLMNEKNNLIVIEWAERLPEDWFPLDRKVFKLKINLDTDHSRTYSLFELS